MSSITFNYQAQSVEENSCSISFVRKCTRNCSFLPASCTSILTQSSLNFFYYYYSSGSTEKQHDHKFATFMPDMSNFVLVQNIGEVTQKKYYHRLVTETPDISTFVLVWICRTSPKNHKKPQDRNNHRNMPMQHLQVPKNSWLQKQP